MKQRFSKRWMQAFYENCLKYGENESFWRGLKGYGTVVHVAYQNGRLGNPGVYMPGTYGAAAWRAGMDSRK